MAIGPNKALLCISVSMNPWGFARRRATTGSCADAARHSGPERRQPRKSSLSLLSNLIIYSFDSWFKCCSISIESILLQCSNQKQVIKLQLLRAASYAKSLIHSSHGHCFFFLKTNLPTQPNTQPPIPKSISMSFHFGDLRAKISQTEGYFR